MLIARRPTLRPAMRAAGRATLKRSFRETWNDMRTEEQDRCVLAGVDSGDRRFDLRKAGTRRAYRGTNRSK